MSKHSTHPAKNRTHPPASDTESSPVEHDEVPTTGYEELPEPAESFANVEPAVSAEDLPGAAEVSASPAVEIPKVRDGLVRVRVSSTHGAARGATVDGQTVFFHPKEVDITVTQEGLKSLLNDPILRVHELVNGFTEAHRKEADLNVERAQMALSEALVVRDRVYARAPALNVASDAVGLLEGGGWQDLQPSGEEIPIPPPPRMARINMPYVQVEDHELGHDVPEETTPSIGKSPSRGPKVG